MKLIDILQPVIIEEGAQRAFKRSGGEIKRYFRCTSGPKKGKLVATPSACMVRKDPKKIRHGRKVARAKKNIITRKSLITKKTSVSKLVARLNKRLKKR